ncbi:MAG: cyclic nucleotide-binding domain-containing protein [Bacteriovoracaceae bacterium]|jgi:CRP-like cAMP-binding protein|nr:cyclic nucleotide-binding domain-containing protein [Bacteriovoracaceae bacterium]
MSSYTQTIKVKSGTVLCREGDKENDLYFVTKGKLLICSRSGYRVTPLAYIGQNEYFGEMSFFDHLHRSADVIAIEETILVKIPNEALKEQFPTWLLILAKTMTKKLRLMDQVISDKGIKRQNVNSIKPLSIEEQREIYNKITEQIE